MLEYRKIKMNNLAIVGASYLQMPLIEKAKEMGYKTHVFAWAANDVGEEAADVFYPISIIEKDRILMKCREIGICGICSIASDLAMLTVNYVADAMGLIGNSLIATEKSTNKHLMRQAFETCGDPSPRSLLVSDVSDLASSSLHYPVIVKPLDRSGSRGITKLSSSDGLAEAIEVAKEQGFLKQALVEEFAEGQEYSVEYISYHGQHHFLAMTKKYTTGAPHFIETGHLEPAPIDDDLLARVKQVTEHALGSLGLTNGASHTELKIAVDGQIRLIEIGGRMGGDFIGSDLVRYSTGVDFVRAVIQVAVDEQPDLQPVCPSRYAGVRFILQEEDVAVLKQLQSEHPECLVYQSFNEGESAEVTDSASRRGVFMFASADKNLILQYLPSME